MAYSLSDKDLRMILIAELYRRGGSLRQVEQFINDNAKEPLPMGDRALNEVLARFDEWRKNRA